MVGAACNVPFPQRDELRRMLEWTRNVTPPIGDMGYEVLPQNPFAVYGGLGGAGTPI